RDLQSQWAERDKTGQTDQDARAWWEAAWGPRGQVRYLMHVAPRVGHGPDEMSRPDEDMETRSVEEDPAIPSPFRDPAREPPRRAHGDGEERPERPDGRLRIPPVEHALTSPGSLGGTEVHLVQQ